MAVIKVEYDDHMGDDLKPCRMAKDSFGRTTDWQPDGTMSNKDKSLLRMLARGMGQDEYAATISEAVAADTPEAAMAVLWRFRHTTPHLAPFGHCFVTFKFQAPVFVMRQIVKHEYIRLSELSMRYVRGMPEYFKPKSWRSVAIDAKQGSGGDHPEQQHWDYELDCAYDEDRKRNAFCVDERLAPEQARMFLRLCHMTQGHISGSMDAIAGLVMKRMDAHAQEETREFARQIDRIMFDLFPLSWDAITEGLDRR